MSSIRGNSVNNSLIILSEQEELNILIKSLASSMLECELTEENGWTPYDIQLLNKLVESDFEVNFKEG